MTTSLCYFALSCCLFFAFQQVANCITCYSCASCSQSSSSWGSASSSTNGAECSKYVYKYGLVYYTDRAVSSSCVAGPDGLGGTTYCCLTDNCNGGVTLSNARISTFALVATISVVKAIIVN